MKWGVLTSRACKALHFIKCQLTQWTDFKGQHVTFKNNFCKSKMSQWMKCILIYQCRSASPTAGTVEVSAAAPTSAAVLRVSRWARARPTISAVCTSSEDIRRINEKLTQQVSAVEGNMTNQHTDYSIQLFDEINTILFGRGKYDFHFIHPKLIFKKLVKNYLF